MLRRRLSSEAETGVLNASGSMEESSVGVEAIDSRREWVMDCERARLVAGSAVVVDVEVVGAPDADADGGKKRLWCGWDVSWLVSESASVVDDEPIDVPRNGSWNPAKKRPKSKSVAEGSWTSVALESVSRLSFVAPPSLCFLLSKSF